MRGHRDTKVSQETIQRGQQVGTVHWRSGDVALAVKRCSRPADYPGNGEGGIRTLGMTAT